MDDIDHNEEEMERVLKEAKDAVEKRDYLHSAECFDKLSYLSFNMLLGYSKGISELEEMLKELENIKSSQEGKEELMREIRQEILSERENYAKYSAKRKRIQELQQKYKQMLPSTN